MKKIVVFFILFIVIFSLFGSSVSEHRGTKIADKLIEFGINPYLVILLIAMLPIVELRLAIPIGILVFKLSVIPVILVSILGNIIPVFFILFLFGFVEKFLRRFKIFNTFFDWLFKRTRAKSTSIEKYEEVGLMLFVAIPAPVTGAWTGSLASYLFKLSYLKSIVFIILGVLIAAGIVTTLTLFKEIGIIVLSIGVLAFAYVFVMGIINSIKKGKSEN